jgi:hypothetical protein
VQFSLIGFRQDTGFRVFTFEGTAADRTRTAYTVRADLALTRKYGIRVQELPLLCRGILERAGEGEQKSGAIFTEEEMRLHSHNCTEARDAAIRRRKSLHRPLTAQAESDI